MAFAVGVSLELAVGLFATVVGLDRDRAFYPTVMLVIAFLYTLFAVLGGSTNALVLECLVGIVFAALTVAGFKSSLWIVAGALAAHGIYDFLHDHVVANPGVPGFWPAFCGAYDVTAAAYLAWLLTRGRIRAVA
jgi:hypothetical protein